MGDSVPQTPTGVNPCKTPAYGTGGSAPRKPPGLRRVRIYPCKKSVSNTHTHTHTHTHALLTFLVCFFMFDCFLSVGGWWVRKCVFEFKDTNTRNQGQNTNTKSDDSKKHAKKCFAEITKQVAHKTQDDSCDAELCTGFFASTHIPAESDDKRERKHNKN